MTCGNETKDVRKHYTGESKLYLCDIGPSIQGRTISSITSMVCEDDPLLIISNSSVLTVDTDDFDGCGNPITIEANTGIQYKLTGGTAATDMRVEYTARIVVTFVTGIGTEQANIFVKVIDPLTEE